MAKLRRLDKRENVKKKPDTLLSLLSAGGQFILMVFGIIGVATAVFSDKGLLSAFFTKITRSDSYTWVMIIPIAFVAIYVGRRWFERAFGKSSSTFIADLAMYVMMALGAFYLFRYLSTGTFTG